MIKENFDADSSAEVILPAAYSNGGFVQVRIAKPMERDAAVPFGYETGIIGASAEDDPDLDPDSEVPVSPRA